MLSIDCLPPPLKFRMQIKILSVSSFELCVDFIGSINTEGPPGKKKALFLPFFSHGFYQVS